MSSALFRSVKDITDPEEIPQQVLLRHLHAHPHNPRLFMREDVIEQIQANMGEYAFDPRYAIVVRADKEYNDKYWIISGHHRVEAARRSNKGYVWAWIRDWTDRSRERTLDDELDYMELLQSNAQSGLTALEKGMHALSMVRAGKWGQSLAAYAEAVGRPEPNVRREVNAAKVANLVADLKFVTVTNFHERNENRDQEKKAYLAGLCDHFSQLVEIHAAPEWLWPAMVEQAVSQNMTKAATHEMVASFKEVEAEDWMDNKADIAKRLVAGSLSLYEAKAMVEHKKEAKSAAETTGESEKETDSTRLHPKPTSEGGLSIRFSRRDQGRSVPLGQKDQRAGD